MPVLGSGASFGLRGSVRDLFRPPILPGKRPAMATPPTITAYANGTSTITNSTLIPYTDPRFRYPGVDLTPYTGWNVMGAAKVQLAVGAGAATSIIRARFGFEGQAFEFRTYAVGGSLYRISVNGQPATDTWTAVGSDSTDRLVKVDMGARGVYDVMIEFWHGLFGGVRIGPTDAITGSPISNPLRMAVLGDSYADGQSAPQTAGGYVFRIGELLGIEDIWPRGIGGTGYITSTTFRSRLAPDVVTYAPDILMIQGSINDTIVNGLPTAGVLTTEINALYAAIKAALPSTLLVATSPLYAKAQSANMLTIASEEQTAWQALGVPYIDGTTWNTGSGNTSATTGTGTADFNCSTDGTHPTQVGYDHLAANLASALAPVLHGGGTAGTFTR